MGVNLLGPVSVDDDGALEPRDRLALAALAVRRGQVVQPGRARRCPLGGRPPVDVGQAGPDLRRTPPEGARRRGHRDHSRRIPARSSPATTSTSTGSSAWSSGAGPLPPPETRTGRSLRSSGPWPPGAVVHTKSLDGWAPGPQRGDPARGAAPRGRGGPARRPAGDRGPPGGRRPMPGRSSPRSRSASGAGRSSPWPSTAAAGRPTPSARLVDGANHPGGTARDRTQRRAGRPRGRASCARIPSSRARPRPPIASTECPYKGLDALRRRRRRHGSSAARPRSTSS